LTYYPDDVIFSALLFRFTNRNFELSDLNLPREFRYDYENPVFRKERRGFVFWRRWLPWALYRVNRMNEKTTILSEACAELSAGRKKQAAVLLWQSYPFAPIQREKRQYTPRQMIEVFVRDGFIDRYGGERLVFPGALRLVSYLLPDTFPYHPHGHMEKGHIAFWELFPTLDHLEPLVRGGKDEMENWVCTSMRRNLLKANWRLGELGWKLHDAGDVTEWDGLLSWFIEYLEINRNLLKESAYLRRWWNAAQPFMVRK